MFNLVGTAIFLAVMYTPIREPILNWVEALKINAEFKVAIFHLSFNLLAATVMVPLLRPASWVCKKLIRH
jgi:Na+/phosphate symporter